MSIRRQNLEPSQGSIHCISAQESLREREREEPERWKRHGDMLSEVEMDRSAIALKTFIERSRERSEKLQIHQYLHDI